jgi:hypothetical protein
VNYMTEYSDNQHSNRGRNSRVRAALCLLCVLLATLSAVLFLSVFLIGLGVPLGIERLTLSSVITFVYFGAILPVFIYIADIVRSLFPWPIFILIFLILILRDPQRIAHGLSWIGKFEGFGIKYEGASVNAPTKALRKELGEAEQGVRQANKEIKEAYETASAYAASLRDKHEIVRKISALAVEIAGLIGEDCPEDYRLTLYIRDLIFSDRIYQLTEYYDKSGGRITDNRAGRAFSIRYGIIGRVWRSGVSEIEGELITEEDKREMGRAGEDVENFADLEKFIARRWGLTLDEAAHVRVYNSYGAIRIDGAGAPVGLVYFDSKAKNAFGDSTVQARIEGRVGGSEIAKSLEEISRETRPWSGQIQIFRPS